MDSLLLCQYYTFVVLRQSDNVLPNYAEDCSRRKILETLRFKYQYLCHDVSGSSKYKKISRMTQFIHGRKYSFVKVKDHVEWDDVKVYLAPLELALKREIGVDFKSLSRYLSHVKTESENNFEVDVNWEALIRLQFVSRQSNFQKFFNIDKTLSSIELSSLIDKCYDEIKMTLIAAVAYQKLFAWFGEALVEIGYKAFDFYTENRDGSRSWQQALKWHIKTYNLEESVEEELLNTHLYPILKFL